MSRWSPDDDDLARDEAEMDRREEQQDAIRDLDPGDRRELQFKRRQRNPPRGAPVRRSDFGKGDDDDGPVLAPF